MKVEGINSPSTKRVHRQKIPLVTYPGFASVFLSIKWRSLYTKKFSNNTIFTCERFLFRIDLKTCVTRYSQDQLCLTSARLAPSSKIKNLNLESFFLFCLWLVCSLPTLLSSSLQSGVRSIKQYSVSIPQVAEWAARILQNVIRTKTWFSSLKLWNATCVRLKFLERQKI